jgi:hypothetical protein
MEKIIFVELSWDVASTTLTLSVNGSEIASGTMSAPSNAGLDGMSLMARRPATITPGTIWGLNYSLGGYLPMSEGDGSTVYDVVNGNSYAITGYASTMWDITQSEFFYSFENGCNGEAVHYSICKISVQWVVKFRQGQTVAVLYDFRGA